MPLVPLVADRSNALNSYWQEPSRLRQPGVSDLAAVAILQEFLHVIYNGVGPVLPICGIESVSLWPVPMNFLPQKLQNVKLVCQ